MCGIAGMIKNMEPVGYLEVYSLALGIEKRGYEGAGICFEEDGDIHVEKVADGIEKLMENVRPYIEKNKIYSLMIHTRWPLVGKASKRNSHPHTDCKNNIFVVHNGMIGNYEKLRERLEKKSHKFRSETDTEVVPHLIEEYFKKYKDVIRACEKVKEELRSGDTYYAILVLRKKFPREFIALREGETNPLYVGFSNSNVIISSQPEIVALYTSEIFYLKDGIFSISPNGIKTHKGGYEKREVGMGVEECLLRKGEHILETLIQKVSKNEKTCDDRNR